LQAVDARHPPLAEDLALLREAAHEGGRIAMRYFRETPEVWMKGGTSPVSEADFAVDRFLAEFLLSARPGYGWLSEETADTPERLAARRTFVVDPIDGTRGFLEGKDTWCVSVAVVEGGRPLAGVLDCPATGEVYAAIQGEGATRNGTPIRVREPHRPPRIGGPKPLLRLAEQELGKSFEKITYVPSLAYRVAMVASGRIDATFVGQNSNDWDLAGADLILREAGGLILDRSGRMPVYASANPKHGALVAGSGALIEALAPVLQTEPS
jgi:myo-inositol-1(or 4)-monophosphatase